MIKAIIFDCFGVLITDALDAIVSELHVTEPEKADQIAYLIEATNRARINPQLTRNAIADILGLSPDEYILSVKNTEVKNQPLLDYIKTLRHRYKTALLSNISSDGLTTRFDHNELQTYFDVVVASGDIGYAKPDVQAYEYTANRLGLRADECLMIDDREEYCQGARAAGMQATRYSSFSQVSAVLNTL